MRTIFRAMYEAITIIAGLFCIVCWVGWLVGRVFVFRRDI